MFEYMARGLPVVCSNFPLWADDRRRRRLRDRRRSARPGRDRRRDPLASTRTRRWPGGSARTAGGRSPSATTGRRSSQARGAVSEGRVTLLVEAPAAYEPERRYVLDVVLGDWLGPRLRAARRASGARCASASPASRTGLACAVPDVLFATPERDWLTAALAARRCASRGGLPVLYGDARRAGQPARLDVDVFGSAFFMLTRYEELVVADRDQLRALPGRGVGRRPRGLPRHPARRRLRRAAVGRPAAVWPRLRRRPRAFEVAAHPRRRRPAGDARARARAIARQLARRPRAPRGPAARACGARALAARGDRRLDPHNTFDFLMDVSERHGLRSAFYFLAHRDGRPARRRLPRSSTRGCAPLIGHVHRRGHEVGLHPSFGTYRDAGRTARGVRPAARGRRGRGRRARSGGAAGSTSCSGRTRRRGATGRRPGSTTTARSPTPRRWASAPGPATRTASSTSSSAGRCDLRERPFQVMDVTLFGYMGLAPDAAHARGVRHRRRVPALPRVPRHPVAQQRGAAHGAREALVRGADRGGQRELSRRSRRARTAARGSDGRR